MIKIYEVFGAVITEVDHVCDCEYCDMGTETALNAIREFVRADSGGAAKAQVMASYQMDPDRDWYREWNLDVAEYTAPEGRVIFAGEARLIELDDGLTNGYIGVLFDYGYALTAVTEEKIKSISDLPGGGKVGAIQRLARKLDPEDAEKVRNFYHWKTGEVIRARDVIQVVEAGLEIWTAQEVHSHKDPYENPFYIVNGNGRIVGLITQAVKTGNK